MLKDIAFITLFGKPLILYTGVLTLLSFLFTAIIGFMNFRGKPVISFKWHPRMAVISITLGIIHGLMGLLAYF